MCVCVCLRVCAAVLTVLHCCRLLLAAVWGLAGFYTGACSTSKTPRADGASRWKVLDVVGGEESWGEEHERKWYGRVGPVWNNRHDGPQR